MNEVMEDLVSQYAEEAAFAWSHRRIATHSGDHRLADLAQVDERLAAYIEGLHVSGASGWRHCEKALEREEAGEIFAAAVIALETCDSARLDKVLNATGRAPQAIPGLASAFGWVEPAALRTVVAGLLESPHPLQRLVAVTACALHRVDPGLGSARRLEDPSPLVRARALRTAGELGEVDSLATCLAALASDEADCRFWAAWSAVLLGNRDLALDTLSRDCVHNGPNRMRAFQLTIQALGLKAGHAWLKTFAADSKNMRWLVQGSGIVGDPAYIPWLIEHMKQPKAARLAAEAVSLITGLSIADSEFEGKRPTGFESGPTDDAEDPDVTIDPDTSLAWPNVGKVEAWWEANRHLFQDGTRFFMGSPLTRERCIEVLRSGLQRQRILAATHLCLLQPGTPLFNTSAPAARQQKLLAQMR